jgi:hypothetical protein
VEGLVGESVEDAAARELNCGFGDVSGFAGLIVSFFRVSARPLYRV